MKLKNDWMSPKEFWQWFIGLVVAFVVYKTITGW